MPFRQVKTYIYHAQKQILWVGFVFLDMGAGRLFRDFPEKSGKSGFVGKSDFYCFPYLLEKLAQNPRGV